MPRFEFFGDLRGDLAERCAAEAGLRGMTSSELVSDVIEAVARNEQFDALLGPRLRKQADRHRTEQGIAATAASQERRGIEGGEHTLCGMVVPEAVWKAVKSRAYQIRASAGLKAAQAYIVTAMKAEP